MKNIVSFILFASILFGACNYLDAQTQTIPFKLNSSGNILVDATLNDSNKVTLMLHTASNGVTLTQEANATSVNWKKETEVTSWGGGAQARFSKKNKLDIAGLSKNKIKIWENKNSGPESVGKFGLNFFKKKYVEIDYDSKQIKLYDEMPDVVTPESWHQLPIKSQANFLMIDGKFKDDTSTYINQYVIHSGYGGGILIDDQFADTNNIKNIITTTETKELKDSYGNKIVTKVGKLDQLELGGAEIKNVSASFFDGDVTIQKTSILGCEILQQFHIVFDKKRGFVYLKPRKS